MKIAEDLDLSALEAEIFKPGIYLGNSPTIGALVVRVLVYIFSAAGILLLIYLVSAGFQYMTSQGNPKILAVAKGKISNALVGLFIVLVAFWIVQIVGDILGITSISETFTN